jgi:hypothetical protein
MQINFPRWLDTLMDVAMTRLPERKQPESPEPNMLVVIEQARQEWLNTDRYFDCVTDPELVDHAIMMKEAAQKKYMYLLKQARSEGVKAFNRQPVLDDSEAEASSSILIREL